VTFCSLCPLNTCDSMQVFLHRAAAIFAFFVRRTAVNLCCTHENLQHFFYTVIEKFDNGFIRDVMPRVLRRQVAMTQMLHAPHLLYNCQHTNKTGVKHTRNRRILCVQNV